jgi:O-antigen/teichoic acid export membrane protein
MASPDLPPQIRVSCFMARVTIAFGLGLCIATVAMLLNAETDPISTACIPMMFGIPLFICGVISLNPHRRRRWIWFASLLALIGGVGSSLRLGQLVLWWMRDQTVEPLRIWIAAGLTIALLLYALAMYRVLKRFTPPPAS